MDLSRNLYFLLFCEWFEGWIHFSLFVTRSPNTSLWVSAGSTNFVMVPTLLILLSNGRLLCFSRNRSYLTEFFSSFTRMSFSVPHMLLLDLQMCPSFYFLVIFCTSGPPKDIAMAFRVGLAQEKAAGVLFDLTQKEE